MTRHLYKDGGARCQSFTEADLTALRAAGYAEPFTSLKNGLAQSVDAWHSA